MRVRFYIDPDTGDTHIAKHGVTVEEVISVLNNPGEDRPGREGARVALGQTSSGRFLRIVYVPEPDSVFVITAYDLKGNPLKAYKRRVRKKGKKI